MYCIPPATTPTLVSKTHTSAELLHAKTVCTLSGNPCLGVARTSWERFVPVRRINNKLGLVTSHKPCESEFSPPARHNPSVRQRRPRRLSVQQFQQFGRGVQGLRSACCASQAPAHQKRILASFYTSSRNSCLHSLTETMRVARGCEQCGSLITNMFAVRNLSLPFSQSSWPTDAIRVAFCYNVHSPTVILVKKRKGSQKPWLPGLHGS